jgi:hypothetical protein
MLFQYICSYPPYLEIISSFSYLRMCRSNKGSPSKQHENCVNQELTYKPKGRRYLRKASDKMDKSVINVLSQKHYLIFLVSAEVTNAVFFKEFVIIFLG